MAEQRLIPLHEAAAWHRALHGLPHATAHAWSYNLAVSFSTPDRIFLYCYESDCARIVCPLVERAWKGRLDVVTPYGFSGFAGIGFDPEFETCWNRFAIEQGWICVYIGIHPAMNADACFANDARETGNEVFIVNLQQSEDALFTGLSPNVKERLRAWRKTGARIVDEPERARSFFLANYADCMQRAGASPVYQFSRATLDALAEVEGTFFLAAENAGGRIEAVSLFGETKFCGEYLFNISLPDGRHHSAALLWEAMLRLRQRGTPRLNLGGGVRRGDGLAQFKARFGGEAQPMRAIKTVFLDDAYLACCREARVHPAKEGYFPPYRQPRTIERATTGAVR